MSVANLIGSGSSTDATSYTTASISPASSACLLLVVGAELSGADPGIPTITGNGLTWTQVTSNYYHTSGTNGRVTLFRAATGSSSSAGTVLIDFGATRAGCEWVIDQVTGGDFGGTNAADLFVQFTTGSTPSANTTLEITLSAALAAGNVGYCGLQFQANETGNAETGGTAWTKLAQGGHSAPSNTCITQWRNASDDNSATTTWTTSALAGGIIAELKNAGPPPLRPFGVGGARQFAQLIAT